MDYKNVLQYVLGLIVSTPKFVLFPEPQNVTVFVNSVTADVISEDEGILALG